jgi:hypothetical protein
VHPAFPESALSAEHFQGVHLVFPVRSRRVSESAPSISRECTQCKAFPESALGISHLRAESFRLRALNFQRVHTLELTGSRGGVQILEKPCVLSGSAGCTLERGVLLGKRRVGGARCWLLLF